MNYENKQQVKQRTKKGETHTRDCFETLRMLKATNHTLSRWGNGYKKGDITSCISTIYRRQKTIRKYSKWNIHSIEVQHYSKGNKHHLERNATR